VEINNTTLDAVIEQFDHLTRALIDASSVIYMEKADFLDMLKDSIDLHSLPEILDEAGIDLKRIKEVKSKNAALSNDQKLIRCALDLNLPVISEDKKILNTLRNHGVPYFNALMMLNFLLYKERITSESYPYYLDALLQIAWYSNKVWAFGERLNAHILKGPVR
jgi:hypothetical protein